MFGFSPLPRCVIFDRACGAIAALRANIARDAENSACYGARDAHNRGFGLITHCHAMSFLIRFAACAAAVLGLSVLAAMAWDQSDQAAQAQEAQQDQAQLSQR
jgi:hypothetical protein